MANQTKLRHPAETPFLNRDGTITIEWSAWYSMVDKVAAPMATLPNETLSSLGTTLTDIQEVPQSIGVDSLAEAIATLESRISTLEVYIQEILFMFGTNRVCLVSTLPDPVVDDLHPHISNMSSTVLVTNEIGGPTLAFSDGTNWRRVQDRAVVS